MLDEKKTEAKNLVTLPLLSLTWPKTLTPPRVLLLVSHCFSCKCKEKRIRKDKRKMKRTKEFTWRKNTIKGVSPQKDSGPAGLFNSLV